MRGVKLFLLVILFLGLFEVNVYSLIRGRIDGVVKDKETGNSLEGCIMTLYRKARTGEYFENMETKTDKKGNFKFDQIKPGTYIVGCQKAGYITYHPDYIVIIQQAPPGLVKEVNLNEGEIKHFIIHMEKGGSIKIEVLKKDENGISPYNQYIASLSYKENDKVIGIYPPKPDEETGETFVDGLKPSDKYKIEIYAKEKIGYPIYKSQIEIKKNETTTVSHTFDFTDNTGVTGIITFNNNPVDIATIKLEKIEGKSVSQALLNEGGKYTFKNIEPGMYRIIVSFTDFEKEKSYLKYKIVQVEKNIIREINFMIE